MRLVIKNNNNHEQNPVVALVTTLLEHAIRRKASDIHLESTVSGLRVRYRIDGILYEVEPIDAILMPQVISRIKVLAHINIAEKRMPQDGKFSITCFDTFIDLRVSTFPSLYGEKVVIRILDRAQNNIALESLGMSSDMLEQFNQLIIKSYGFLLVAGPTGSGKTTTLYAALSKLNEPSKNIVTLEDPIEYCVDGIVQSQINTEAGFTFSKGIRSLLRQDPDICMVGEIRDKETASIAIEAALTGHLVLSTVHTNDAPSSIMRFMDMGIEPFLINAAITGVLAQRLVRKICQTCRVLVEPDDKEVKTLTNLGLSLDKVYKGVGCQDCKGLGFKGRTGIFELLIMTSSLRSLIVKNQDFDAIYAQALADGMITLKADGANKVKQGIITISELLRAVV